jgi:Fe-S-cluster containining protein
VTRKEVERLAQLLRLSVEELGGRYLRRVGRRYSLVEKAGGDCVFYDGGCTVYEARPVQCRTFPFWSENLASPEAWEEAREECPGMGAGAFFSIDEIRVIEKGLSDVSSERKTERDAAG